MRGSSQFEFIQIENILGDRFRGFQFPDEEKILLWAILLIRNVTDHNSDVFQRNFVCFQDVYGKNMSVGYSLRSGTEIPRNPPDAFKHAMYDNPPNCYWLGIITAILTPLSGFIVFLLQRYWKQITGLCTNIFRQQKPLVQPTGTTSPTPSALPAHTPNAWTINMESEDSREPCPGVGTSSKTDIQPLGLQ